MEPSDKTARELYGEMKREPMRRRFGCGQRQILVDIDLLAACMAVGEFATTCQPGI